MPSVATHGAKSKASLVPTRRASLFIAVSEAEPSSEAGKCKVFTKRETIFRRKRRRVEVFFSVRQVSGCENSDVIDLTQAVRFFSPHPTSGSIPDALRFFFSGFLRHSILPPRRTSPCRHTGKSFPFAFHSDVWLKNGNFSPRSRNPFPMNDRSCRSYRQSFRVGPAATLTESSSIMA